MTKKNFVSLGLQSNKYGISASAVLKAHALLNTTNRLLMNGAFLKKKHYLILICAPCFLWYVQHLHTCFQSELASLMRNKVLS